MARHKHSLIAYREAQAKQIRRTIRAAQLRVALDKDRGRTTPEAVIRIAQRKLPEVTVETALPRTQQKMSAQ